MRIRSPGADGHVLYFLRPDADGFSSTEAADAIKAGDVLIEDCTFENIGYEAIRISETEKYIVDSPVASLTVRNCTFTNVDAECVRYYSDLDAVTADAPVLIENLTINNCGTRVMFLKNSGGAIVRNIIISNSRMSLHPRNEDILDAQGNTDMPSFVSHIDTFNILIPALMDSLEIESADGEVDRATIYGYDPMYVDAENGDYTLADGSMLYSLGFEGADMGDLRWAIYSGPASAIDGISASPQGFRLAQNYPNPFNPTTSIDFSLSAAGWTNLEVYNLLGQRVATLIDGNYQPGDYSITFTGANIPSGLYFYRLQQREFSTIHKMVLLK
ncbi:T9SS type A sorting domain-containing protein [Candidatus Neomarinimicrobiota bacterium]